MNNDKIIEPTINETITGFAPGIWLTVSEVSALTGAHVNSIREACAERDGKYRGGRYTFRKAGKPYEILLSSLPPAAQEKYAHEHLDAMRKASPVQAPATQSTALAITTAPPVHYDFAVYDAIWDSYSRKAAGIKAEAQRRVQILDEFDELIALKTNVGAAEAIIKQRHGDASKPTLWRWRKLVDGHPRQYWEALLAPQYAGRSRTEIHPQAWDFFRVEYGQQAEPNATVIYRETVKAAVANGWGALPSCKTFERRWDSDVPDNEKILSRKGKTALKESLPHLKRDFTTLKIHEVWESDGRVSDTSCRWPDGTVARPWVVVIRDVRTRMPLAVKIYTSTNVELVIDAYRNAVMLTGTQPVYCHFDNGTEYSNNPFTGGQKSKVRKISVTKNQPPGVLTRGGVKVIWTTARHGAAKSIESWWNVIAEHVDKYYRRAYTGRNPVERPEDWDPKHAVPIEEYAARLISVIAAWAKGEMGEHRGQGMNGMSPLALYNSLMPSHEKRPATAEQLRAMRPLIFSRTLSTQRVFQLTLAGFGKVEYWPDDKNEEVRRGYQYDILPDPADPKAPALIYDGARYMGEATYKTHTPYLSESAGGEIAERRGSALKKAGAGLRAAKQRVEGTTPQFAPCEGLPALMQSELLDVLKLPKEQPAEAVSIIQILDDGSALNTQTGEVTKPLAAPTIPEQTVNAEADELERKWIAKQEAELLQWKAQTG